MSFEEAGRTIDSAMQSMTASLGRLARSISRTVQLAFAPHPNAEGRRLTEDLSRERYDAVERSDVRVERVPATTTDGEAARVTYHDGSEWSHVTRYDLDSIERSLEGS